MSFDEFDDTYKIIGGYSYENEENHKPVEDYELPYTKCALCGRDSLNYSLLYVSESGLCSKDGISITVKSHKNTYLCFKCINKVT